MEKVYFLKPTEIFSNEEPVGIPQISLVVGVFYKIDNTTIKFEDSDYIYNNVDLTFDRNKLNRVLYETNFRSLPNELIENVDYFYYFCKENNKYFLRYTPSTIEEKKMDEVLFFNPQDIEE